MARRIGSSVFERDSFNRADGTGLGTADDGSTYTAGGFPGGDMKISGNTATGNDANNAGGAYNSASYGEAKRFRSKLGAVPSANNDGYEIWMRMANPGASQEGWRVIAQKSSGGVLGLLVHRFNVGGGGTAISPVAGSATTPGTGGTANDEIFMEICETGSGTLFTIARISAGVWQAPTSYFDTNASRKTTAGQIQFGIDSGASTPVYKFDQWGAETVPARTATRFYLEASGGTPPVSPSFDGGWEKTNTIIARRMMYPRKQGTTIGTSTFTSNGVSGTDTLAFQAVSMPLAEQLIHGHFKSIIRVAESAAAVNGAAQMSLRVMKPDGTFVTLIAMGTSGNSAGAAPEWATSLTDRKFPLSWATPGAIMTPTYCPAGSRIVWEIGLGQTSTTAAAQSISLGSSAGSDLAEDESGTTANNPWGEFLTGLEFLPREQAPAMGVGGMF